MFGDRECVSGGVLVSVREKGKRELKKNMDMGGGVGKKEKNGKRRMSDRRKSARRQRPILQSRHIGLSYIL